MSSIDRIRELLEKFSNASGISGYESQVAALLEKELSGLVDKIEFDKLGNLIGIRSGKSPSVMIAAHMDEIGFMTKYLDDHGFIRFIKVGGWHDQMILGQRVVIHTPKGPIRGVIGSKPPHAMTEEERQKLIKSEDMFIDIGASSKQQAEELGIRPGLPVTLDIEFKPLSRNRVCGKAFDNRAGIVMMIEALRRTQAQVQIYCVGTVQEEVGLKGARTSAYALNPDLGIAAEISYSGDHPGIEKKESSVELGKGPVITVMDAEGRGIITPQSVLRWLMETAQRNQIPYQLEVIRGGTTDASAIFLTRAGIPAGAISVPTRYIHSSVEVLDLVDLDRCAELIARALELVPEYF